MWLEKKYWVLHSQAEAFHFCSHVLYHIFYLEYYLQGAVHKLQ
jgi:hypothetical protein